MIKGDMIKGMSQMSYIFFFEILAKKESQFFCLVLFSELINYL